jgi:hypothetical protein
LNVFSYFCLIVIARLLDLNKGNDEDDEERRRNKSAIEEEEKQFKDEAIDDLWSEIRDDDKSIEMPQVEKGQITLMPTTNELRRSEVGQMTTATTSSSTEVEAIPLVRMTHKAEVTDERKEIKVSTACGPSPDREIEELLSNEANAKPINMTTEVPTRLSKVSVSIGTSPPPQSISTQVMNYYLHFLDCFLPPLRDLKFFQHVFMT